MSKFLRLTNLIININHIHTIDIKPNKYCINIMSNKLAGLQWTAAGFGIGQIASHNYEIEVCETTDSSDYKIVSDFIHKH
jgi:hypothetical protein